MGQNEEMLIYKKIYDIFNTIYTTYIKKEGANEADEWGRMRTCQGHTANNHRMQVMIMMMMKIMFMMFTVISRISQNHKQILLMKYDKKYNTRTVQREFLVISPSHSNLWGASPEPPSHTSPSPQLRRSPLTPAKAPPNGHPSQHSDDFLKLLSGYMYQGRVDFKRYLLECKT